MKELRAPKLKSLMISIIVLCVFSLLITFHKQENNGLNNQPLGITKLLKKNNQPVGNEYYNCGHIDMFVPQTSFGLPFVYKEVDINLCKDWNYSQSNFAFLLDVFIAFTVSISTGFISYKILSKESKK